ncbi:MAG TPA: SDR family oxidoreductase [Planctomycetes bacterium]|nr:SDR family oxidoreductase [Planctomycetota bacterium]
MCQNGYLDEVFGIDGEVAVITGGGGVLCGSMAKALGELGVKVAVLDIAEDAAKAVAAEITDDGGKAAAYKADVLDRKNLEAVRKAVEEDLGPIDILVNGAGGNSPKATTSDKMSFFDLPKEGFEWVFALNFLGTLLPTQVFAKGMADRGRGSIVNISSMNALRPLTRIPAYSAAKAAVTNFTQWLAVHINQNYSKKIRVNAVAPGFFVTAQNKFLLIDEKTGDLTPRGKTIIDHTPMGRFGVPEDLVTTLLWLLAKGSSLINGTVIPVDGGFSAFSGV